MDKIYVVHCWDGTKDDGWYPWLDRKYLMTLLRCIDLICQILNPLKWMNGFRN